MQYGGLLHFEECRNLKKQKLKIVSDILLRNRVNDMLYHCVGFHCGC